MNRVMRQVVGWTSVMILTACGKSTASPDVEPTKPTEAATNEATSVPTSETPDTAATEEVVVVADDVAADKDTVAAALKRASEVEVPRMTRARSQLQSDYVTLAYDTPPNAKSNIASVEVTISACPDCPQPDLAALEAQKDARVAALGELHAKNKGLVFETGALELMPQRRGVATYVRSWVSDETTRAALHTLEVSFVENGFMLRFFAYPRSGMGATADEFAAGYDRAELEADVKAVFASVSAALWPPAEP